MSIPTTFQSPVFPYGMTVTLVKRTLAGQDANGNDVYTEKTLQVPNTVFVPGGASENLVFTDQTTTIEQFYVPWGTDVTAYDAIIFQGIEYEIQGVPSQWVSPFSGRPSPIRVDTIKVSGVSILWPRGVGMTLLWAGNQNSF
jgi:hypothetical protein